MADDQETEFPDIEALLSRPPIPPSLRNPRIAELEAEVHQLQERCTSLADINERRSDMLRMQTELNDRLDAEIERQKTQIKELQAKHTDAIDSMNAQDAEVRDYQTEIEYLRGLVNELQPPVDQLNGLQLELQTHRVAVDVLFELLRDSHPNTRIQDILAQCKAEVLAIDAAKGIFHSQEPAIGREEEDDGIPTVGDFIDDLASEASRDDTIADDDSMHDFLDDGDDIQRTPPCPKRKRYPLTQPKEEREDRDFAPRTPKRARISSAGAPLTPPSSQRKTLPRKAKITPKGSAFYNLKRLSDAGRGDQ